MSFLYLTNNNKNKLLFYTNTYKSVYILLDLTNNEPLMIDNVFFVC